MPSDEEPNSYYVKFKGRITGPMTEEQLKQAVRRGRVTRAHSVSLDRSEWMPATEVESLFSGGAAANSDGEKAGEPSGEDLLPDFANAPPPPPAMPIAEVPPLRWLCPGCQSELNVPASASGETAECPVCKTRSIAPESHLGEARTTSSPSRPRHTPSLSPAARIRNLNLGVGIAIGALALAFMQVPLIVTDEKAVFWWDLVAASGTRVGTLVILVLAAAAALCVVSPLISGIARGAVFLSLGVIGIVAVAAIFDHPFALWLLPFAVMVSGARWRSWYHNQLGPRLMLCISGAIAFLAALILLILALASDDDGLSEFSNWVEVVTLTLIVLGTCAGFVVSLLGMASVRAAYIPAQNLAIAVLAPIAAFMPYVGVLLFMAELESLVAEYTAGWLTIFALRMVLGLVGLYCLVLYGLLELVLAATEQIETGPANQPAR